MIGTANIPKAYSEVYSFLNALGSDYINKIPAQIYNTIKNNRDIGYSPKYDKTQTINEDNISKEALSLISAINLQYWSTCENEKNELKREYINNKMLKDDVNEKSNKEVGHWLVITKKSMIKIIFEKIVRLFKNKAESRNA